MNCTEFEALTKFLKRTKLWQVLLGQRQKLPYTCSTTTSQITR